MTVADDLEQARAALTMIHSEPFNAEAPPEALQGDITATELQYVRSNFLVPEHAETELRGPVVDQAALHGIITRLECLGVELIALQPYPEGRLAAET